MSRRVLAVFALAVLSTGCIPVAEPVGDIDKAEPDKKLLGEWRGEKHEELWVVDHPEVKGNPRGLMRAIFVPKGKKVEDAKPGSVCWFFLAKVGKHAYANVLLVGGENHPDFAQLEKEGAYAAWAKNEKRGYGIVLLAIEGETITISMEADSQVEKLMKANQFVESDHIYKTPPGWLAKHLEKHGPDGLFEKMDTFSRMKK